MEEARAAAWPDHAGHAQAAAATPAAATPQQQIGLLLASSSGAPQAAASTASTLALSGAQAEQAIRHPPRSQADACMLAQVRTQTTIGHAQLQAPAQASPSLLPQPRVPHTTVAEGVGLPTRARAAADSTFSLATGEIFGRQPDQPMQSVRQHPVAKQQQQDHHHENGCGVNHELAQGAPVVQGAARSFDGNNGQVMQPDALADKARGLVEEALTCAAEYGWPALSRGLQLECLYVTYTEKRLSIMNIVKWLVTCVPTVLPWGPTICLVQFSLSCSFQVSHQYLSISI
jgi:hypothetical protein